jgi:ferrous iron transport protein A
MSMSPHGDRPSAKAHDERQRLGRLDRRTKAMVVRVDGSAANAVGGMPGGELERRLIEIGFVEGASVEVVHEGFLGRDPIAVRVNDHVVALRRREANAIHVRPLARTA